MVKSLSSNGRRALDVVSLVAGLGLLLSPWYLGFTSDAYAAWNAWIIGAAISVIAVVALLAFHEAEEWINGVAGLWALVAPWALGFSALTGAMWAHVIAGVVVALASGACIWFAHNRIWSAV
ncbi:conserved membrane hypothetical protein [Hyphomicrobiales bacterium]|uniref:SPW repeat-containing integral membrane domain-containing protein n=1 Tax=Methylocystis echinoides TaxID=29468 RepID=A0A9W6GZF3_9HYPH|nr:SPW repeat protein [Methylocystis echinoides]RTM08463.1 MAG: hypothetical protein EKK31_09220 [Hyphomicrobiales bacterium]GLI95952.1 hypothetical protein LMG27198_49440 [Methylocystis echinoides]CAH1696172.1 conserved membrane hypothetical protein [Hyphomicrobiales bacterium]CAH1696201.1 conserved membrane hypothetical protein [Hyphomicrobiales bacterium]